MIKPMTEKDYLKSRVDDQIVWYDKKSQKSQKNYKRLKFLEIFFSVSIPVMSAIQAGGNVDILIYIIGAAGGLIALIAGMLTLHKYHEKWIQYRLTTENLKRERIFYESRMGPYSPSKAGKDTYPTLVERIEAILANENAEWGKYMIDNKEDSPRS